MAKKIPTSAFARGTKLMGLAGKIVLNEVSSRVKTWDDQNTKLQNKIGMAQDVVKTLSHLKGASMKLGQLMSMDLSQYLPPEIIKILEQLHAQVTFLPYEKIETILKKELSKKFPDLKNISEKPIAAASIGQVHRATLNGEEVVIKVQYPGVAESIPSDIKILKLIVSQLGMFQGKKVDFTSFFEEIESVLVKEADYRHELKMHELYREKFKDTPYIIPKVYPEYSTDKIITQEYIQGESLISFIEKNPSYEDRFRLADLFLKLYMTELFEFGLVQTDPNPGNFLITPDQSIALLDFGAVKVYDTSFIEGYRRVLDAAHYNKRELLLSESIRMGFIDARESDDAKNTYLEMMDLLAAPFSSGEEFDFGDQSFLNKSRDYSWELTRKCKYSPPPRELIFLHRKLVGIFVLIKKLDIKLRLKDYWEDFLQN